MGESEQSFERQLSSFLNEYPLLWTVYTFITILPIVLLIAYIWPRKRVDSAAQRKKTDALTPDDKVTSSEMRKKRGVSGRETHEERTGQSVVTEKTRQEEEGSLSSSESQPNRTGFAVEREVEVQHEREREEEEAAPETTVSNEAAVLRNGDITASTVSDSKPITKAKEDTSSALLNGGVVENGYHDNDDPVVENGIVDHLTVENGEENGVEKKRWSFPPVLDDFNLMESDVDPADLEEIFADDRLKEINLHIQPASPGLGISIVGGSGSPSGDLPILIKRVLPKSLAEEDGRLKQGDELVAVNDNLLVGMSKDFAIEALSNMHGDVRLLVLQEY